MTENAAKREFYGVDWSIGNLVRPITHAQFVNLVEDFKREAEQLLKTPLKVYITADGHALDGVRDTSAEEIYARQFGEDETMPKFEWEKAATIGKSPRQISKGEWEHTHNIQVGFRPADKKDTPTRAGGNLAFKWRGKDNQVDCYIQMVIDPEDKDFRGKMNQFRKRIALRPQNPVKRLAASLAPKADAR